MSGQEQSGLSRWERCRAWILAIAALMTAAAALITALNGCRPF